MKPLWLCKIGLHRWRHVMGPRHWHVECRRCGRREIWEHFVDGVYHPIDANWPRSAVH